MGVSINLEVYPVSTLLNEIEEWVDGLPPGKIPVREFVRALMPEFGLVENGKFYVVCNEYYEDYNPSVEFMRAITLYYRSDEDAGIFSSRSYEIYSKGANAEEVLDELLGEDYE